LNKFGGTGGNTISGNKECGIKIEGEDNVLASNTIGIDPSGEIAVPNKIGVHLLGKDNVLTEVPNRNTISGNLEYGVKLAGEDNLVSGCRIGTDSSGKTAVPNRVGVYVMGEDCALGVGMEVGYQKVSNLISGNTEWGVILNGDNDTSLKRNYIGLDIHGEIAIPNGNGIHIEDSANLLIERCVISGNRGNGIYISGQIGMRDPEYITIRYNTIGTDDSGKRKLGNGQHGIAITNWHGCQTEGRRVISNWVYYNVRCGIWLWKTEGAEIAANILNGNCRGIMLTDSPDNKIYNNRIVNNTCTSSGIHLDNSSPEIVGNTITGDKGHGIFCTNGSNPVIRYNNIYSNSGFDLSNDGTTIIDAQYNWWGSPDGAGAGFNGDVDTGNMLTAEVSAGNVSFLEGSNSSSLLNGSLRVDYATKANITLSVLEFGVSPLGAPEGAIGRTFMLQVDDTANITAFSLEIYYTQEEIAGMKESTLTPRYWDSGAWQECSDWELVTTDPGNFSGHVAITLAGSRGPAFSQLSELFVVLTAETGTDVHTITHTIDTISDELRPGMRVNITGTITVEPAENVKSVKILLDGTELATATFDGQGYTGAITLPADLLEGKHTITVNVTLDTGESAEKSTTITYKKVGEEEDDDDDEGMGAGAIIAVVLVVVVLLAVVLLKMGMIPLEGKKEEKERPRRLLEKQESEEKKDEEKDRGEEAATEEPDETGESGEEKKEEEKGTAIM